MADREPDRTNKGLRWNGHRIPLISWIASWFNRSGDHITVKDWIAIGVIVGLLVAFAVAHMVGSGSSDATSGESDGGGSVTNRESPENETDGTKAAGPKSNSPTVVEYADNRAGSPVFADPTGTPVKGVRSRIPYGTEVVVSCFAPNESGVTSVSGFYRIASGEWQGDYVVTDTMTNGGKVGTTDSPNVDSRVRECEAEE